MLTKTQNGQEVPLSQEEIDDFYAREAVHEVAKAEYEKVAFRDRRLNKYNERGATNQDRLDALWEKIMENRPEEADRLQVIRQNVKAEEPKPS